MVVKSIAQFFYYLIYGGGGFNTDPEIFLKALFNYPIYLFNSWNANSTDWLPFDQWFSLRVGITSLNYGVMLCYGLAFFVLLGIVLGIFNLVKKCLSLGRL